MLQFSPAQNLSIAGLAQRRNYSRCVSAAMLGECTDHSLQTGKELVLPELPVTIRLIGLRVTRLKDLRAPSPSVGGIKRVRLSHCITRQFM